MRAFRRIAGIVVCGSLLALASGLGSTAAEYVIVLDDMAFGPVPAEVHPGDTITWRNDDIFRHSATANDDSFDVDLPAKSSASMVVGAAGNIDFFCKFHPGMTGTLVVSP